jgi:hypothetical protein
VNARAGAAGAKAHPRRRSRPKRACRQKATPIPSDGWQHYFERGVFHPWALAAESELRDEATRSVHEILEIFGASGLAEFAIEAAIDRRDLYRLLTVAQFWLHPSTDWVYPLKSVTPRGNA